MYGRFLGLAALPRSGIDAEIDSCHGNVDCILA